MYISPRVRVRVRVRASPNPCTGASWVAELEAVWSSSVALAKKHGSDPIAQRSELCA